MNRLERRARIDAFRRLLPMSELERKAKKARNKHSWTVEEIDLACVRGEQLYKLFYGEDE